ncbi:MAG: DUF58 domain-containing protein [Chloroflexota bacterium]|nr:MAG: DUF58 domain-containing protein [Chloroflexota bacterium]
MSTPENHVPGPRPLFEEAFLRKLERIAILSNRAVTGQMQGERRSPKRGQSVEFADFRPYTEGDDFRRIDWNAYARLERFFIKLFVEEEDLTVHLLVDASRSMDWGAPNKLEYALRTVGALGYIALSGLDRVTVTALGKNGSGSNFAPRRGKQQAFALFSYLQALMPPAGGPAAGRSTPGLDNQLRYYAGVATQPGPLLLLSDLMDEGWAEGLRALASRGFEISVLHILSPDEVKPELTGDLKLLDSETMSDIEITAEYDLIQRYRKSLAEWQEEVHRFCSARRINYVPIETSLPFDELLFAWLRRQGVLK